MASRQSAYDFAWCSPSLGLRLVRFASTNPSGLPSSLPYNIIAEALALGVLHARNRKLAIAVLIQQPTGFFQQQVDVVIASFGFVVIMIFRYICRRFLRLGNFLP
jgi:hypothetical protein